MSTNGRTWEVFHRMDRDANGVLDRREFERGIQELGFDISRRELDALMSYFDTNGSGRIGYQNFADFIEESSSRRGSNTRRSSRTLERIIEMVKEKARDGRFDLHRPFRHFDRDNRGYVSRRNF